jgi:AAA+ superfamily predicted ATPase
MALSTLPTKKKEIPSGISLEAPGNCLASLSLSDELNENIRSITDQWQHREAFDEVAKYGITPTKLVLFWGPPGNGKTSAAKLIAKQLGVDLYRVRCEHLIGSHYGESTAKLSKVMDYLESPTPAVVLFDEVETILVSRLRSGNGEASMESNRMQAAFWQYLDRWTSPQLFILATNLSERIDPAVSSRVEMSLKFDAPSQEQIAAVVKYWAEIFHAYAPEKWEAELAAHPFESFRDMWQAIQHSVRCEVLSRG